MIRSTSLIWRVSLLIAAALLATLILTSINSRDSKEIQVKILSGPANGGFNSFANSLTSTLKKDGIKLEPIVTKGSADNLSKLGNYDQPTIALALSNASGSGNERTIALLHEEFLVVFIKDEFANTFKNFEDLSKLEKVSIGYPKSGTEQITTRLFNNRLPKGRILVEDKNVGAEFKNNKLNAAVLLTTPGTTLFTQLCATPGIQLFGLGTSANSIDSAKSRVISLLNPSLQPVTLPPGLCGQLPAQEIHTVSIRSALITHEKTDEEIVNRFTKSFFKNRVAISEKFPLNANVREKYEPENVPYPYHEGATSYYLRKDPVFIVKYAELLSLLLALGLSLYSSAKSFSSWNHSRKKNLIDEYYKDIKSIELSEDPHQIKERELLDLRSRAFTDLIDEKLEGNETFVIFQDYLESVLERVRYESRTTL